MSPLQEIAGLTNESENQHFALIRPAISALFLRRVLPLDSHDTKTLNTNMEPKKLVVCKRFFFCQGKD